jgi:hypothetical protein
MLAMALSRRRWLWRNVAIDDHANDDVLSPPSHAGDGVAEATLSMALSATMQT